MQDNTFYSRNYNKKKLIFDQIVPPNIFLLTSKLDLSYMIILHVSFNKECGEPIILAVRINILQFNKANQIDHFHRNKGDG